ncbi:hypothetical protein NQZ68_035538 [Dissostichus eleginoides]|nr:hypothetical protein NQZ68_035538 [Dissostichus eleginoides]
MAGFGLRRTQSLKSLSGVQERSWVMPALTRWDRKSVSQLVQHCVDGGLRRLDTGGENLALSGSGRSSNLSRSCSMDFLPQREPSGTRALCALFESKAGLHKSFTSNPRLNTGSKTERDCPLQDWRSPNTSLKDTTNQRADQVEGRKAMNGLPESSARASRHSHDRVRLLLMALTVTQTLALGAMPIRVKQLISGSVRCNTQWCDVLCRALLYEPPFGTQVFITVCECGYNRQQLTVVKVVESKTTRGDANKTKQTQDIYFLLGERQISSLSVKSSSYRLHRRLSKARNCQYFRNKS